MQVHTMGCLVYRVDDASSSRPLYKLSSHQESLAVKHILQHSLFFWGQKLGMMKSKKDSNKADLSEKLEDQTSI